ncbi:MAG: hypothetical protein JXR84_12860 [Anaerolineae bacterium]|nr:hypothetical protein [Anaerolineae bacterium]
MTPVSPEHTWWGDATGPYHPIINPGGIGNQVSDNVDFIPWLSDRFEPLRQISPPSLDFGSMLNLIKLYITPDSPSDSWSLDEDIPWLSLSRSSGTGPATVWATANRSGMAQDKYNGIIYAQVGGENGTHVAMLEVATPEVTILEPPDGINVRTSDVFLVRAYVESGSTPATGVSVVTSISLGDPWSVNGTLYDDGQHEDGNANDGIYAAQVPLPDRMTMPPGPYILTVTGEVNGVSGSASVGLNVFGEYAGAPEVTVTVEGPNPTKFTRGDMVTVTAVVTFPDLSIHNDSTTLVTIYQPDGSSEQIGLANE